MRIVSLDEVNPGMELAKPIYDDQERLLLNKGTSLNEQYRKRLIELGVTEIYIEDESSLGIEISPAINEKLRVRGKKAIRKVIEEISKEEKFNVREVEEVVTEIFDEIFLNSDYLLYFGDLRVKNDTVFGHSLNVAVISVAIGSFLFHEREDLIKMGIGALLHDIGKTLLSDDVAGENPLNTEDKSFRSHPELGYSLIRDRFDISPVSKAVVLKHHERVDGKGYPNKAPGEKIHEYAKIVAIANTFDILTNGPYYKKKFPVYQAVEYLIGNSNIMFDKRLVDVFVRRLALYPNGTYVKLSTGEAGIIKEQNKNYPTRPMVRVLRDRYGQSYNAPRIEDLMKNHSIVIVE